MKQNKVLFLTLLIITLWVFMVKGLNITFKQSTTDKKETTPTPQSNYTTGENKTPTGGNYPTDSETGKVLPDYLTGDKSSNSSNLGRSYTN